MVRAWSFKPPEFQAFPGVLYLPITVLREFFSQKDQVIYAYPIDRSRQEMFEQNTKMEEYHEDG